MDVACSIPAAYALADHPLFQPLTEIQRQQLLAQSHCQSLDKGVTIYRENETAHSLGLLLSGSAKVMRLSREGQEKIFRIISAGEVFLEELLFSHTSLHTCSVQTLSEAEVLHISLAAYKNLLPDTPELYLLLARHIAQAEQHSMDTMEILSCSKSVHRVIRYLLCQALQACPGCNAKKFELPAPKRAIASQLAIQPETFSRILHQLEREGLLLIDGRTICLLDLDALAFYP